MDLFKYIFESFTSVCEPTEMQSNEYESPSEAPPASTTDPGNPIAPDHDESALGEPKGEQGNLKNATSSQLEETKTRQPSKSVVRETEQAATDEKAADDKLVVTTADLLSRLRLIQKFQGQEAFIERWMRLDEVLREHRVQRNDMHSALNLLLLYRGSESKNERAEKIKSWCVELKNSNSDDEFLYESGLQEARAVFPDVQFYDWGVLKLKDILARNLKRRVHNRPSSSLRPGTLAAIPADLMEVNLKLKAFQANLLFNEFKGIDLSEPEVHRLDFDTLRLYLQSRSKISPSKRSSSHLPLETKISPAKRPGETLHDVVVKTPKLKEGSNAPSQTGTPILNPPPVIKEQPTIFKRVRSCRKVSLDCLQKWVNRDLPCKFCKKKIFDPCTQCRQDIAASSVILFFECRHFMHKSCVASAHAKQKKCPQCLKPYKAPPVQLN